MKKQTWIVVAFVLVAAQQGVDAQALPQPSEGATPGRLQ